MELEAAQGSETVVCVCVSENSKNVSSDEAGFVNKVLLALTHTHSFSIFYGVSLRPQWEN